MILCIAKTKGTEDDYREHIVAKGHQGENLDSRIENKEEIGKD